MFVQAYLNNAKEILTQYKGEEPLNSFLKKYFAANKKFGSRDRKQITHLCYCFFRLGKSLSNYSVNDRLAIALFLCSNSHSLLLEKINAGWNKKVELTIEEKIKLISEEYDFKPDDIFPWQQYLSDSIEYESFAKSFFIQPDIFLRLRPGKESIVKNKLAAASVPFQVITNHCLSIAPFIKLDEIIEINKEAIIQDLNSQQTLDIFTKHTHLKDKVQTAWDCCAASGGKSILLKDYLPDVDLTVSDIRESILVNLDKRLKQAGIKNYRKHALDLSQSSFPKKEQFDLIICDAPCSGSGTWSRTPEQAYFFKEERIQQYAGLQKKIITNAASSLKAGGYFLYITCSVFKNENEEVVEYVQDNLNLKLLDKTYLKGYASKSDTLFTALFTSQS
jgi:16S rRNA (cytosine967-C5)-methyltransferase